MEGKYYVSLWFSLVMVPEIAEGVTGKYFGRIPVVPEERQCRADVGEEEVEREPVVVAQRTVHFTQIEDLKNE